MVSLPQDPTLTSNLSFSTSSFTVQLFTKCLKQVRNRSSFLLEIQHLRFNRITPTNMKHFQIKTRIDSITTIQLNSKDNNPKINIKVNNNLKA